MYKKITRNFSKNKRQKPKEGTLTDKIQNIKAMKEKLKGYEQVSNIDDVPLNTHLRYVTLVNENGSYVQKFRLGGNLIKKAPDYIKLQSKDFHWCVQKKHYNKDKTQVLFETIFFQKISQATIDKKIIVHSQQEIKKLKSEINNLRFENTRLRQQLQTKLGTKFLNTLRS